MLLRKHPVQKRMAVSPVCIAHDHEIPLAWVYVREQNNECDSTSKKDRVRDVWWWMTNWICRARSQPN